MKAPEPAAPAWIQRELVGPAAVEQAAVALLDGLEPERVAVPGAGAVEVGGGQPQRQPRAGERREVGAVVRVGPGIGDRLAVARVVGADGQQLEAVRARLEGARRRRRDADGVPRARGR